MIADSVAAIVASGREALFDCEHFFDGYKANADYAVACARAAHDAGAAWVVLCDTNGGALPDEVHRIVCALRCKVRGIRLGIHCHNDCGLAVANSLAAVAAGARQIQGTINGLGERCGNADLVTLVAILSLKTEFELGVDREQVRGLRKLSRLLDARLGRVPNTQAPFVGDAAFAHKGGVHASAVMRDPRTYEHIAPELVGNERIFVVSNQSGRSNVLARLEGMGLGARRLEAKTVGRLIDEVKAREFEGWSFDKAEASFELLVRRVLKEVPVFFRVTMFKVVEERRQFPLSYDASGGHAPACANTLHASTSQIEASVRIEAESSAVSRSCCGVTPLAAAEAALRGAVVEMFPELRAVSLRGFQVRTLSGASCSNAYGADSSAPPSPASCSGGDLWGAGGAADVDVAHGTKGLGTQDVGSVRVLVECIEDGGEQALAHTWRTVAVSSSVLDAFVLAYCDALIWRLLRSSSCPAGHPLTKLN
jgi:2-isopropylmalate synthase